MVQGLTERRWSGKYVTGWTTENLFMAGAADNFYLRNMHTGKGAH
jgi:hypothetical protein